MDSVVEAFLAKLEDVLFMLQHAPLTPFAPLEHLVDLIALVGALGGSMTGNGGTVFCTSLFALLNNSLRLWHDEPTDGSTDGSTHGSTHESNGWTAHGRPTHGSADGTASLRQPECLGRSLRWDTTFTISVRQLQCLSLRWRSRHGETSSDQSPSASVSGMGGGGFGALAQQTGSAFGGQVVTRASLLEARIY